MRFDGTPADSAGRTGVSSRNDTGSVSCTAHESAPENVSEAKAVTFSSADIDTDDIYIDKVSGFSSGDYDYGDDIQGVARSSQLPGLLSSGIDVVYVNGLKKDSEYLKKG